MDALLWVLGSVLIVSLVSLAGVFTLFRERIMRKYLLLLVSLSAGTLFGDAFIHLLPEAFKAENASLWTVSLPILAGIVFFLVLEKIVHWHHCHGRGEECHHEKTLGWMNLVGDAVHNFVDGMVIAGSFLVSIPLGIATTIAVFFHELPQEISDFGVLLHAGFTKQRALLFNFVSALFAFGGAIVVLALNDSVPGLEETLVAFTAGGFIYIAGTDLIPELRKETSLEQNLLQLFFILLGITIMAGLLLVEAG